jgi:hypothetical protein
VNILRFVLLDIRKKNSRIDRIDSKNGTGGESMKLVDTPIIARRMEIRDLGMVESIPLNTIHCKVQILALCQL